MAQVAQVLAVIVEEGGPSGPRVAQVRHFNLGHLLPPCDAVKQEVAQVAPSFSNKLAVKNIGW